MDQQKKIKYQSIYLPFLLLMVGVFFGYGLLRWLFDIQLGFLPFSEDMLDYWIPIALPWLPLSIWIHPRIQLLQLSWDKENAYSFYLYLMAIVIILPTCISQQYLKTSSFALIEVDTAEQIQATPNEKYFKIQAFELDTSEMVSYTSAKVIGKNEDQVQYQASFLCPFPGTASLWYGFSYKEVCSHSLNEQEEADYHQRFLRTSKKALSKALFPKNTPYFERIVPSNTPTYFHTVFNEYYPNLDPSTVTILLPQDHEFETRTGNSFFWTWASFFLGLLLIWIMVTSPPLEDTASVTFEQELNHRKPLLKQLLQAINPRGTYKATAFLFWMPIIIFMGSLFLGVGNYVPNSKQWLSWGFLSGEAVLKQGEYWRIFTALLVPGSFSLLLINSFALLFAGFFLEPLLGSFKSLWSYFILGIIANFASVYWYRLDLWAPAGSVGIVGWCGLLLFFGLIRTYVPPHRKAFCFFLVVYGLLLWGLSILGSFNTAAHHFSFWGGIEFGLVLHFMQGKTLAQRANIL
ncbi:MAG: rhomboid family intramembrane serine protease [Aureispira sp.]